MDIFLQQTINGLTVGGIYALIALGYSVMESQRAVQGLPRDVTGVEERLRLALSRFAS